MRMPLTIASLLLCVLPAAQPDDIRDLPITEFPGSGAPAPTLALLLTGDGAWAALDTHLAKYFAVHGVAVAGVNMRSYLGKERTPDDVAADMTRVLRHYLAAWHRDRIAVIGYSRGADIAPFIVTRLPPDLRARVDLIAMLGPAKNANFQFHLIDLVRDVQRPADRPTLPEIARLRGTRMLCIYGTEETESACRSVDSTLVTIVARTGGHRIDRDFDEVSATVLRALPR
jgi:type IV secretory pathway VirJ component